MNLETTRLRGSPRNKWQDEVREDGRLVGGEVWKERVYNREEWKKILGMVRNRRILHMPTEQMNVHILVCSIEVSSYNVMSGINRLLPCYKLDPTACLNDTLVIM